VPSSIGEHLRRVRLDRDLWQKDVAREIGCSAASLLNWEKGRAEPELRFLPAILRFLGYDPRALEALGDLGLGESRRLESVCNKKKYRAPTLYRRASNLELGWQRKGAAHEPQAFPRSSETPPMH
jgi:transcriptional regulator with XRE-family HTH domain